MMSEFNIPPMQFPDEELLQLMAGSVADWWNENKERILALEKVFADTCVMDQLGFIHDKATGKLIAGSKLDWFNKMLEDK